MVSGDVTPDPILGAGGTDRDRWMAFFASFGIPLAPNDENMNLHVEAGVSPAVVGHQGVCVIVEFDPEGTFQQFGVWE